MKHTILLFAALIIGVTLSAAAQAARYPLNNWVPGDNTFWQTIVQPYHTGVDAGAAAGTPVLAPFPSTIKEARTSDTFGGIVVGESYVNGEWITWASGHMQKITVKAGQVVSEGMQIAEVGAYGTATGKIYKNGVWTGKYWPVHNHFQTHIGRYTTGNACDGTWIYHGYGASCDHPSWHNPMLLVPFAQKYDQLGGTAKLGTPQGNFQWSGSADYRIYNGGSYGECIIVNTSTGPWLVRTGFWQKYKAILATNSAIGLPTGDEYVYLCTATCNLSRQNFQKGYMIWDCSGSVKVYNTSNVQIYGASPVMDETPMVTPVLSLAISPNPTHASPTIRFSLPASGAVSLDVFDVAGRKVATLISGQQPAGEQTIAWQRTSDSGEHVGAGLYFVRLVTPTQTLNRQVVVLN